MGRTRTLVSLLSNRTNSSESASLVCLGGVFQAHHYGRILEILSKNYLAFLLSKLLVKSRISERILHIIRQKPLSLSTYCNKKQPLKVISTEVPGKRLSPNIPTECLTYRTCAILTRS